MQDIVELERRITAAMERITRRVERLATQESEGPVGALEEVARLNEALDEERMTNAQLKERIRALREKEAQTQTEAQTGGAEDEAAALRAHLAAQNDEIATLRRVLAEAGREIASLRAARAAEAEEAAEILAALDPLVSAAQGHETKSEAPHA